MSPRLRGWSRRGFVAYGGTVLGGALLSTHRGFGAADTTTLPTRAADPIWDDDGAATKIIRSLQHLTQAAYPAAEFPVTRYGAQPCRVIPQTPFLGAPASPLSAGAERTAAPGSFDARPAFLAAIAACSAAGGGRVAVPAGNWYCAGPIVLLSHVNFHLAALPAHHLRQPPPGRLRLRWPGRLRSHWTALLRPLAGKRLPELWLAGLRTLCHPYRA